MTAPVEIVETYRDWTPPLEVKRAIQGMLDSIPQRYLVGLGSVVLTNASGLNHARHRAKTLRRGRKVRIATAAGLYHPSWQGRPAYIEMFLDNIFYGAPRAALSISFLRDLLLGKVLFHEIGHHIHRTSAPEFREQEDVADRWSQQLLRAYLRDRYWYVRLPWAFRLVRALVNMAARIAACTARPTANNRVEPTRKEPRAARARR